MISQGALGRARRRAVGVTDPYGLLALVTALGGNSHVLALYDARTGITLDGSNNLATWDDARGAAGYGPQRVGYGSPKPAVTSDEVICDGTQNYVATAAAETIYDLSVQKTVLWVATVPVGSAQHAWTIQDVPLAQWDSVGVNGGLIEARIRGNAATNTRLAPSTNRRLFEIVFGGPSTDPNGGDNPKWVRAHSRLPSAIDDSTNNGPAGARYQSVGRFLDRTNYSATKERAMIVVDHYLSVTEYAAVAAWVATYHPITESVGSPAIIFDGNSLTNGYGASDPATTSYPAKVAANFLTYEILNAGVNGRTGGTQLSVLSTRILPLYNAGRGINGYVYWEGINDMYHGPVSAAVAYANTRDACLAAKTQGFKVVVLSCITGTWAPSGSGNETKRLAYNALIAANWPSFADGYADVAAIPELSDYTNATYFNADQIHLTDAGYNKVANAATYGVTAALTPFL